VTLDDFNQWLDGFQHAGQGWLHGDFDYSGDVTLDDFNQWLFAFQHQGGRLDVLEQSITSSVDLSTADRVLMLAAIDAVPEPNCLTLVLPLLPATLARRR
jgi:hypothetical protein